MKSDSSKGQILEKSENGELKEESEHPDRSNVNETSESTVAKPETRNASASTQEANPVADPSLDKTDNNDEWIVLREGLPAPNQVVNSTPVDPVVVQGQLDTAFTGPQLIMPSQMPCSPPLGQVLTNQAYLAGLAAVQANLAGMSSMQPCSPMETNSQLQFRPLGFVQAASGNIAVMPAVRADPNDDTGAKPRVHRWTHSDIMELIWCWCEASMEPKVDSRGGRGQKWKLIYERFGPRHPWSSETSIRAYFKTKVKDKYNCRVVYDYISQTLTLPPETEQAIYQR